MQLHFMDTAYFISNIELDAEGFMKILEDFKDVFDFSILEKNFFVQPQIMKLLLKWKNKQASVRIE